MKNFPLHLARKYIFSGKNAIEVNFISWIAFISLGFVTTCLILILSVFSGLEDFNLKFYSDINPDIKISPAKGKTLLNTAQLVKILNQNKEIAAFSRVIEEKAFISYQDKTHIINLKGVDDNISQIFPLDTMMRVGTPIHSTEPDDINMGIGVATRLSIYLDDPNPLTLYTPKPGKGLISSEKEAFNTTKAFNNGIFYINDTYDNHVFSTLQKAQQLLGLSPDTFYAVEIKTKPDTDVNQLSEQLQQQLGSAYKVQTRKQLDAAFLKMMNTENLIMYLILILVLIIASFNLAGTVAILIMYKRPESSTLWSMGMTNQKLRKTFFYTGFSISVYALLIGLALGSFIAWLQQTFGFYTISMYTPYPVKFALKNYIITIVSVLLIGAVVSWLVSRQAGVKQLAKR